MIVSTTCFLRRTGGNPSLFFGGVSPVCARAARLYASHAWKAGANYQTWRPGGIGQVTEPQAAKKLVASHLETRAIQGDPSYSELHISYPKGFEGSDVEKEVMEMVSGRRYVLAPGSSDNWGPWLIDTFKKGTCTTTVTAYPSHAGSDNLMQPDPVLSFLLLLERYLMQNEVWHAQNALRSDLNREFERVSGLFRDVYGRTVKLEQGVANVSKSVAKLIDSKEFQDALKLVVMGRDGTKGLIDDPEFKKKIRAIVKEED